MYLVNAFYEIDLATYPSDRHLVRSIYGQPLKLGINIDQCASGGRIENVHFWCFWSSGTDSQYMVPGPINSGAKTYGPNTMRAYMAANSIAIKLGHTQFETVDDIFGIGYHAGIELCPSSVDNGAPSGQFSNINFDGADCGLLVYATDPSGVHILNLNVANASQLGTTRIGIYFPTSTVDSGYVYVTGASFWGYLYEGVNWCGGGRISVTNSNFLEWLGPEAVAVASGRVILTGNIFGNIPGIGGMSKTTLNVNIGSGCDRAVITGNDFVNGLPAQIGNTLSVSYGNLQ
jgi:hypothetical protein